MSLQLEERLKELKELLRRPEVQIAMQERCEEQGHDYENCCSFLMEIYQRCKWCGGIKN